MPLGWWASPEVAPVMAVLAFNSVGPLLREGAKGSDGAFHFNTSSIPWVEEVGKFVFTSACLLVSLQACRSRPYQGLPFCVS